MELALQCLRVAGITALVLGGLQHGSWLEMLALRQLRQVELDVLAARGFSTQASEFEGRRQRAIICCEHAWRLVAIRGGLAALCQSTGLCLASIDGVHY